MSLAWTDAQGRLMRGLSTFKSEWLAQSLSSDTSTCWLVSCWILSFRNPGNGPYVALVPSSKSSVRPILMTCNKTLSNSKAQNTHLLWLSTVLWVVSAHWCFSQTIIWLSGMAELCKHPQLVWELAGWLLGAGIGCQCEGLHVVFPKHGSLKMECLKHSPKVLASGTPYHLGFCRFMCHCLLRLSMRWKDAMAETGKLITKTWLTGPNCLVHVGLKDGTFRGLWWRWCFVDWWGANRTEHLGALEKMNF